MKKKKARLVVLTNQDYNEHVNRPAKSDERAFHAVEKAQDFTASDVNTREGGQHRQIALQTVDILRSNIIGFSNTLTQSDERTLINVVQGLTSLIQQTSQSSTQQQAPFSVTTAGPTAVPTAALPGQNIEDLPELLLEGT